MLKYTPFYHFHVQSRCFLLSLVSRWFVRKFRIYQRLSRFMLFTLNLTFTFVSIPASDFAQLSPALWQFFQQRYGGGPEVWIRPWTFDWISSYTHFSAPTTASRQQHNRTQSEPIWTVPYSTDAMPLLKSCSPPNEMNRINLLSMNLFCFFILLTSQTR